MLFQIADKDDHHNWNAFFVCLMLHVALVWQKRYMESISKLSIHQTIVCNTFIEMVSDQNSIVQILTKYALGIDHFKNKIKLLRTCKMYPSTMDLSQIY